MTQSIPPIVPMSYPDITDAERQAVMSVLETPILSIGPQVEAFEEAISQFFRQSPCHCSQLWYGWAAPVRARRRH